jgi:L-asparaginase
MVKSRGWDSRCDDPENLSPCACLSIQYLYFHPVPLAMASPSCTPLPLVVVLGLGGTIAAAATEAAEQTRYRAGALPVGQLLDSIAGCPLPPTWQIEAEQIAQIDSKDLAVGHWQSLLARVAQHLSRPEVRGLVITHGTDTLEETAYLLQRVFAPARPVVLTAAMRPATSLQADGPQNLRDAITLAAHPQAHGVMTVLAGCALSGTEVRKVHGHRLDAFSGGDAGPIGRCINGLWQFYRAFPGGDSLWDELRSVLLGPDSGWPRVVQLPSHAGLDAELMATVVETLCAQGVQGFVVEGTGHGTVHKVLENALSPQRIGSRPVWISSRCIAGGIPTDLTPAQARIELIIRLMLDSR